MEEEGFWVYGVLSCPSPNPVDIILFSHFHYWFSLLLTHILFICHLKYKFFIFFI